MKSTATSEPGKREALARVPVERKRSAKDQGKSSIVVGTEFGHTRAVFLRGSSSLLGRAVDLLLITDLLAGAVAMIALLVFVYVWQIVPPFSLLLALGVYFGVAMLMPARTPDMLIADGLTACELERILAHGRVTVAKIELHAEHAPTPAARSRVQGIAATANRILDDLEERPRNVPEARFAFEALLHAAVAALERYQKFAQSSGAVALRGREVLEERVFPTIERGFQQLLDKLLKDDLRALSVDVEVLEQMLDLEGLSEEQSL